jgi:DNA (cytosine-5)-methyltransferase 1
MTHAAKNQKNIGSLFAGIGGFDLGFERAGWSTEWAVEIDPAKRAVLGDRFPAARLFEDINTVDVSQLSGVDAVVGGFPCQDISIMGACRKGGVPGLKGARSGLFYRAMDLIREIRPEWVVLENVAALLHSNDSEDLQAVVSTLADSGYVGYWRVLNAQYFGVPQNRRRVFLVAGLGRQPSIDFLADAAPVDSLPCALGPLSQPRPADFFASNTLLATSTRTRIDIGTAVFVAQEDGRDQMVERQRASELHGIPLGLDAPNFVQAHGAGNAVVPAIAQWIAEILNRS